MAPQNEIPIAATVLGIIGTILWFTQLIPQIWTNWRTKDCEGLPAAMMFLWAISGVPFGIYAIVQNFNIPVQIQPQIFMLLCLVSWGQILFYYHKWPLWKVLATCCATGAVFGGVEAALILTIKPIYHAGNSTPVVIIGIFGAILLAAGLLPPYEQAWTRKGRIVGISWLFLSMDSGGALFSLFSLVAQNSFDLLGGVMYLVVILLEVGIFSSHLIWMLRTRHIRKQAKADGKTFDDVAAEYAQRGEPFKFAARSPPAWPWQNKGDKRGADDLEMATGSDHNASGTAADVENAKLSDPVNTEKGYGKKNDDTGSIT